jgi:hypothetical protein
MRQIKKRNETFLGKPVYYSDVYINEPERFIGFVKQLNELCLSQEKI